MGFDALVCEICDGVKIKTKANDSTADHPQSNDFGYHITLNSFPSLDRLRDQYPSITRSRTPSQTPPDYDMYGYVAYGMDEESVTKGSGGASYRLTIHRQHKHCVHQKIVPDVCLVPNAAE